MAYNISAFAGAGAQFFDSNGVPLAGGLLYVYTAGTTTPATTWTTNSGAVANTNPIVLNAAGRTPYEIWLNSGVTYKFALYTSTSVLIGTYDNIPAIDDPTVFNNLITVTGTNTLIGTSVPPYTSYVAGMTLSFIPVNTNTGAVTIDVDGLGAKNIFVGNASALTGSELVAGRIANLEYDGTRFQLFTSVIANDAVTTAKIANSAVTYTKIQNVSAGKVLGRDTSGAGVVQELPIAVDTNGNIGVGITPSAWGASTAKAIQLLGGGGSAITGALYSPGAGSNGNGLVNNAYYNAGWKYVYTSSYGASRYEADNGTHLWSIAAAGTAGNAITWTTAMQVDTSANLLFNSGYGSAATAYGCRAWVNFNGTGTVAIRASGNVSSITDNGTGDYTVNFTTAMPDANYAVVGTGRNDAGAGCGTVFIKSASVPLAGSVRIETGAVAGSLSVSDLPIVDVVIFR